MDGCGDGRCARRRGARPPPTRRLPIPSRRMPRRSVRTRRSSTGGFGDGDRRGALGQRFRPRSGPAGRRTTPDDVLTGPASDLPSGDRTVEAWVQADTPGTDVLTYGDFKLEVADRAIVAAGQRFSLGASDDRFLTDGRWHQVVVTYGAGALTAYADGVLLGHAAGVAHDRHERHLPCRARARGRDGRAGRARRLPARARRRHGRRALRRLRQRQPRRGVGAHGHRARSQPGADRVQPAPGRAPDRPAAGGRLRRRGVAGGQAARRADDRCEPGQQHVRRPPRRLRRRARQRARGDDARDGARRRRLRRERAGRGLPRRRRRGDVLFHADQRRRARAVLAPERRRCAGQRPLRARSDRPLRRARGRVRRAGRGSRLGAELRALRVRRHDLGARRDRAAGRRPHARGVGRDRHPRDARDRLRRLQGRRRGARDRRLRSADRAARRRSPPLHRRPLA